MDLFGTIGSILLAGCSIPLLYETVKTRKVGISWPFLLTWFIGEVCTLIYIFPTLDIYLLFNYGINTAILTYLVSFKYGTEKKTRHKSKTDVI